ncbi:MAG TPA: RNA polymerase sigma factor [Planctomycetaceae bacterium]|jgi:RNA polymerase sigma-70 factor (ECF subfamily)|nr:RNA polymerase sigma factor [Planctomycetaceae bacterium]
MEDDASLVRETICGDASAFSLLYDRYARIIRAVCFDTTQDLHSAQELAQEVFLRAFSRLPGLRSPDRFGPWIVSISKHVCREWRRSRRRDRHRYTDKPPEPSDLPIDDRAESVAQLRLMITRLPEKERLALHILYLQGETAEVACRLMGLSHSGFYKIVAQARERLAELLSAEWESVR